VRTARIFDGQKVAKCTSEIIAVGKEAGFRSFQSDSQETRQSVMFQQKSRRNVHQKEVDMVNARMSCNDEDGGHHKRERGRPASFTRAHLKRPHHP